MSQFPENTIPAFFSAANAGAHWIELDIQMTADGHLVVTHDEDTKRVTGLSCIVPLATLSDLKKLNFGAYMDGTGFSAIPLLSEVFEIIKPFNCRISIQPKMNGLIAPAMKTAAMAGMSDRIAFNDTNCEYLIEARRRDSQISLFWDRLPGTDHETDFEIASKYRFSALVYLKQGITPGLVAQIHKHGIAAGACVVNDLNDFRRLRELGITHFYTDYPIEFLKDI
ncbi:MAG: glycerophosphodiester phosphodiesterase [Bacteroidota bacterium]|jgi:glycerophosphoryl diester phosphodiesterase